MQIVFATNNVHKLSEIRAILGRQMEILSLADIGCHDDIPETADTLEGNARIKARFARNTVGVHIRRTDNTVSMSRSTPEGFRRAMDREIKRDFKVRFFLATDDEALKATLVQEYPDRIITQRIIGSYWSSFTDTAAELRQIPLEIVQE